MGLRILIWLVASLAGWLLFKPAGTILFAIGLLNLRAIVRRNARHWVSPFAAMLFGVLAGLGSALVIQATSRYSVRSPYLALGVAVTGSLAIYAIGLGVASEERFRTEPEEMELAAKWAAFHAYNIPTMISLWWGFSHGWYLPFR